MEGEGQMNIFQLQGVFRAVARIERSRRGGGSCHDVLCKSNTLIARVPRGMEQKIAGWI